MHNKPEGEFFSTYDHQMQDLVHLLFACKMIVPYLSLFGAPLLALILLSLISGSDFEVWPDCWVLVKLFCTLILWKGSGNTTTTKMKT